MPRALRITRNVLAEFLPDHDAIRQFELLINRSIFDSDDITEGTVNLFYTEARFDASFALKDTDDLVEGVTNFYFTSGRFDTEFATKTTTDLTEGTNLYYTDARVEAVLADLITYGFESTAVSTTVTKTKTEFTGSTASQTITLPAGATGQEVEVFNSATVNVLLSGSSVLGELYPNESACFTYSGSDWIA